MVELNVQRRALTYLLSPSPFSVLSLDRACRYDEMMEYMSKVAEMSTASPTEVRRAIIRAFTLGFFPECETTIPTARRDQSCRPLL